MTNAVWWTVLVKGQLTKCTCDIDVAMSFLMLASITTMAIDGEEEDWRTISLSFWKQILSFSFLLANLKEKQSEKLSIIWEPGTSSRWRGEKKEKIP